MRKTNGILTRRDLLKGSAGAGAALAAPWFVSAAALGRDGKTASSERITLGVIGIGPRCTYDLQAILKQPDVQCVAVCDVQASRLQAGKKLVDTHYKTNDCATYRNFHELLARREIDAVLIATGDRWHAPASILAARAGKDVYSEKPCGHTIAWCQALDDTIRRARSDRSPSANACKPQMMRLTSKVLLATRVSSPNNCAYWACNSATVMASSTANSLATFMCIHSPFLVGLETANPHCH